MRVPAGSWLADCSLLAVSSRGGGRALWRPFSAGPDCVLLALPHGLL